MLILMGKNGPIRIVADGRAVAEKPELTRVQREVRYAAIERQLNGPCGLLRAEKPEPTKN